MGVNILWLRRDLRLSDHAALIAAAEQGAVIPIYILDDETPKHRKMGAASRWWLHHSLSSLDADLRKLGSRLILRRGNVTDILPELAAQTGATSVHCIRHYEPWWRNAEKMLAEKINLVRHHGNYLMPMGSIKTGSGGEYKIYTPFWKALAQYMPPAEPLSAPTFLNSPETWPESDKLEDWNLLPSRPDWAGGMRDMWQGDRECGIGEHGAAQRLHEFFDYADKYDEQRNFPSITGTSFLSPHLHFGEISAAQAWHGAMSAGGSVGTFLKELVWREYAQNIICQYPGYGRKNARENFDNFPWRDLNDEDVQADLSAWKQGKTGYPIVDAGMRELWATGWMHNRVRMITASFLIKHLLIDWRVGEQWFWDTLVDADYASNAINWQWTAGSGVDSNMFVRIMAPLAQSEKFNTRDYIRKWVPELSHLDNPHIHDPEEYGVKPANYPGKIIGHKEARARALAAYAQIKG
ncbi:deoxyribodipyrimidine photolyase [Sphingorhabdus lutea]|uniref:Deoxyribodipyrimidine photolyase n=1 Tax=Sphingorhabdus lutea TaxID=1913578 RepID=A0A1L3JCF3_9SPHN|nr:deoxyribodipyrimidine photo-lyase [Sphingorhabdus lutea]APG62810.1 deoxyribodipyrimidine photolyase [Sphingorhabdus lutea]